MQMCVQIIQHHTCDLYDQQKVNMQSTVHVHALILNDQGRYKLS